MKNFISKFQFLIFSILTLLISISSWIIAKEQTGTVKILFNQLGYFGPALVAIILTLILSTKSKAIKIKSYLPFIAVFAFIIVFAVLYGGTYYEKRKDILLLENPIIIVFALITVGYFIYQFVVNKGNSEIDKLVNIPKTNIIWYVLAAAIYPLLKFAGVLLSIKLFPTQFELPEINLIAIIPFFLFSIIFFAAIGEEIGWRGYALKKLQQKYNPFVSTLFIAIVWSIWHIGYFVLVENYSTQQIPSVVIWTIIATFFSTWFFNKTNGNILILILFHASVNFAIMFVPHPIIVFGLHLILLIVVLITGRFFKKIQIDYNKSE
jgi:membrane protease YdiL (CAAX protease family)